MANPGPQLQKILDFRKSLKESRQVLYHGFANESEFKEEVDRHLRAFAQGKLPKANAPRDKMLLSLPSFVNQKLRPLSFSKVHWEYARVP